jgi:predicted nuclease of predicted toxin-antitoxin system
MSILADECVYQRTVDLVRSWGFSIVTIQEAGLASCKNGEILAYAQKNDCVFLTRDKDFTDIRIYPPPDFKGIIVLKITPSNQHEVHDMLHQLLSTLSLEELQAKLAIVDRKKCRIVEETGSSIKVIR